jgi:hypothetical protein
MAIGISQLIIDFLIPSILMGLGIAIDVAIATISRFRDPTTNFLNWTLPVTISHILLPAIGYYGWWYLGSEFTAFGLVLGLIAFGLIAAFIYEALCEWIDKVPVAALSTITDELFSYLSVGPKGRLMMILAVSMDALWSGPAKAAQAASGVWSPLEVLISFFIAGVAVALVAELSLLAARFLNRISLSDLPSLARWLVAGKMLEATVLFGFGVLSLWNAFAPWIGLGSLYVAIAISGGLMLTIWTIYRRLLMKVQLNELENDML